MSDGPRSLAADDPSIGPTMRERMSNDIRAIIGATGAYRDCDCPAKAGRCTCETPSKEQPK